MKTKLTLLILMMFQTGCAIYDTTPGYQNECNFQVKGNRVVRWKKRPIPVYVHKSLSSPAYHNFSYAVDIWNSTWNHHTGGGGRLFDFVGDVEFDYPFQSPKTSRDKINTLFYLNDEARGVFFKNEQGATLLKSNGLTGTIYDADILVNGLNNDFFYEDDQFDYSVYTNVPGLSAARGLASWAGRPSLWSRILGLFDFLKKFLFKKPDRQVAARRPRISLKESDFISFAIHELGHLAGLMHMQSSRNNVMYSHLTVGQIRRNIDEGALHSLSCVYAPQKHH